LLLSTLWSYPIALKPCLIVRVWVRAWLQVRSTAMGLLGAFGRLASFTTTFMAGRQDQDRQQQ
jgi:hypothetical protein